MMAGYLTSPLWLEKLGLMMMMTMYATLSTACWTWKGSVLAIWRVLRYNPFSKAGFDPPQWPPIG